MKIAKIGDSQKHFQNMKCVDNKVPHTEKRREKRDQQIKFSVGTEAQFTGEAQGEGNKASPLVLTMSGQWLWSHH